MSKFLHHFCGEKKFLLAPFAGRSSGQHYKLVTAKENTTIVYKCGTSAATELTLESAGHGEYLDFPASSYCSLAAKGAKRNFFPQQK